MSSEECTHDSVDTIYIYIYRCPVVCPVDMDIGKIVCPVVCPKPKNFKLDIMKFVCPVVCPVYFWTSFLYVQLYVQFFGNLSFFVNIPCFFQFIFKSWSFFPSKFITTEIFSNDIFALSDYTG